MDHLSSSPIYRQSNRDWTVVDDNAGQTDIPVLHVSTQHALMQAIGYAKYTAEPYERIYLRGQRELYDSLRPSAYRHFQASVSAQDKTHQKLAQVVADFKASCPIASQIDDDALEPLLQHYGIATTWLDVVDNIWVALWFALHEARGCGKRNEFVHFDRRIADGKNQFGYLLLVKADFSTRASQKKGFMFGRETETVDLRIAAPSVFLRPHAQHGLLFRAKGSVPGQLEKLARVADYSKFVVGIIRFDLKNALNWMGNGEIHSIRSLFPPPYFDSGYKILLDSGVSHPYLGCIHHVGA